MDGEYGRVQEDSEGLGLSKQQVKQDLSWAGKIWGAKAGGDGNDGEQAWRHWCAGFETAIVHGNEDGGQAVGEEEPQGQEDFCFIFAVRV